MNNLSAQEAWEELAEQLIDEEGGEVFQWENNFEELSELRENPININTATKEQLERFPFLSDKLIENILYYLYKYGPMLSENELWMIEDINRQTIRCLQPFICFKHTEKDVYGIQFHPEVHHTPKGSTIFENFYEICKKRCNND